MGKGLEVISGYTTAVGATLTTVTNVSGDSNQIRNGKDGNIWLLGAWVKSQADGEFRIFSPALHDAVNGMRGTHTSAAIYPLLPKGAPELLKAQDNLSIQLSGSATGGDLDIISLLVYYENLQGVSANLITPQELAARRVKNGKMGTVNTLSLTTGTGGYTGSEAISAETNNFKPNTNYAILGYLVNTNACATIGLKGAFSGGLRIGVPGYAANKDVTRSWFLDLSRDMGIGLIPVFNSAEVGSLLVDGLQDENAADPTVNFIIEELKD